MQNKTALVPLQQEAHHQPEATTAGQPTQANLAEMATNLQAILGQHVLQPQANVSGGNPFAALYPGTFRPLPSTPPPPPAPHHPPSSNNSEMQVLLVGVERQIYNRQSETLSSSHANLSISTMINGKIICWTVHR